MEQSEIRAMAEAARAKEKQSLKEFMEDISQKAKYNYQKDGNLQPVIIIFKNKEISVIGLSWANDKEKSIAMEGIVEKFAPVDKYIFVVEAWAKKMDISKEEGKKDYEAIEKKGKAIQDFSDKYEIILIHGEDRYGTRLSKTLKIKKGFILEEGKIEEHDFETTAWKGIFGKAN